MEGHSHRTWGLAHFCDMARLRSLTMYLDVSHVRRKQEGIIQMAYLAGNTSGQPDFRMSRNLRTLQGIDYVRQLRGLRVLRVLESKTCEPVRDWSFLLDLETYAPLRLKWGRETTLTSNRACKRNKPYAQHQKSLLKNLLPLSKRYSPSKWEWEIVESYYDLEWNPDKTPEDDGISMMNPVVLSSSETPPLPTDVREPVGSPDQVVDAADVGNNSTGVGVSIDSVSRTGTSPSQREEGDEDHVSTVVGINGNGLDRDGSTSGMGGLAHAATPPQVGDGDMEAAVFDMVDIGEASSAPDPAQVAQDLWSQLPQEPGASADGVAEGPGQVPETEPEESLFVEHSYVRPLSEPSVDVNHESDHCTDYQNLAFGAAPTERLSVEDPSTKPTAEPDLYIDPEGHIDEPLDYPNQSLEPEPRGKAPKSELWAGAELNVPDRKPHVQDSGDERAVSEHEETSPGPFEIRPTRESKRPPSQGFKRVASKGLKRPCYGFKHLPTSYRRNRDSSDRSSAGDEHSSSSDPDEEFDDKLASETSPKTAGFASISEEGEDEQGTYRSRDGEDENEDAGEGTSKEDRTDASDSRAMRGGSEEDGPYEALLASKTKKRKRADTSPGRVWKAPRGGV